MSTTFYVTLVSPWVLRTLSTGEDLPEMDFRLDPRSFYGALRKLWVNVTIDEYAGEWEFCDTTGTIIGSIESNNIISISHGSTQQMVSFLNWYREFIPQEYTLYFFHFGQINGLVIKGYSRVSENDLAIF